VYNIILYFVRRRPVLKLPSPRNPAVHFQQSIFQRSSRSLNVSLFRETTHDSYQCRIPALGPWALPSRTEPLARKYLPGFPYSNDLCEDQARKLAAFITPLSATIPAQPFSSSINNKITSLKKLFHHSQLGAPQ